MCVRKKKQKDYNMKIFYQSWLRFIYILVILIKVIVWIVMEKKGSMVGQEKWENVFGDITKGDEDNRL